VSAELPSRRTMLGALAFAPVLAGSAPTTMLPCAAASQLWSAALAEYRAARARFDAAMVTHSEVERRYHATKPPELHFCPDHINQTPASFAVRRDERRQAIEAYRVASGVVATERAQTEACAAHEAALNNLLATPAQDVAAIAIKIRLVIEWDFGADELTGVATDLERLADGSPAGALHITRVAA